MDRQDILECRLFWYHRFCRTLMGIGMMMVAFACCIWTFQIYPAPQAVLLMALVGVLPLRAGRLLARRIHGMAIPVTVIVAAMLSGIALLLRFRYPEVTLKDLLLLVLTVSVAEMLMYFSDEQLERRILTPRLYAAGRRVRSYTVNVAGIVAPAAVAVLMSACAYHTVVSVSLGILIVGALLSLATGLLSLRHSAVPDEEPEEAIGVLYPDTALAFYVQNFCMAMTDGALLAPMLLSRATVGTLASVVVWFFVGLSLGQLFDPLQHFYASERKGYGKNCALALLALSLLFGMARTGWQWNVCAGLGGVLLAAGWGNLEQMRVRRHRRMPLLRACAWLPGLALGIGCGNALEWIMARFGAISDICARLTGLGEGSGMAMTFVLAGFLSLAALYIGNRLIRNHE